MDTGRIARLLGETDVFRVLDQETLRELASNVLVRTVDKGQSICVQDDPGDRMYVVAEGVVKLVVRSPRGEVVELMRHWPGGTFGELSLLDGGPRTATAEAVERSTVIVIHRDEVLKLLRSSADVAEALLRSLAAMVRRTDRQATERVFLHLPGRVAAQLLELDEAIKRDRSPKPRSHRITQTELAQMVGATRQSVNQALRTLEARGLIRMGPQGIKILDHAGLRRRATL